MRWPPSVLLALTLGAPATSHAQAAAELLDQAVRAYQSLEFEVAAGYLRRALAFSGAAGLPRPERARALIHLAATELIRERPDSARSAARQLVLLDPRYRPDELVFPPEVLNLFEEMRRATKAVFTRPPLSPLAVAEFRPGEQGFVIRLFASSFHEITAAVTLEDGRPFRALYTGPIGDSLDLRWDGLDTAGALVPAGRYTFTVTSRDGPTVVRMLHVPLEVTVVTSDTLPLPLPPADSQLLAERRPVGPALKALAPGAVVGAAIVLLPSLVAGGEDAAGGRVVVGGAVTLGGVIGFFAQRPRAAIRENVERNRAVRDRWRDARAAAAAENVRRRRDRRLQIRAGEPVMLTP
ncbi:MAG: hypothetical protein ACREL9_13670 [Gemmatimonadales bacterium]